MADIRITQGSTGVPLTDQIVVDNVAYDLDGAGVKFRMRARASSTLKVDAAAVVTDADNGRVRYNWQAADVNKEGEYFGWWRVEPGAGDPFDTPEFKILIDAHAPGYTITTGALADRVRGHMPESYGMLIANRNFGEPLIQQHVDTVKYLCFATVVDAALEATLYDHVLLDYVGKLATLQVIPAATDAWANTPTGQTTTGTSETVSFGDRVTNLWKLHERLLADVKRDRWMVAGQIRPMRRGAIPILDAKSRTPMRSGDPRDFWTQYATESDLVRQVSAWA